jgi:hypothetical protein
MILWSVKSLGVDILPKTKLKKPELLVTWSLPEQRNQNNIYNQTGADLSPVNWQIISGNTRWVYKRSSRDQQVQLFFRSLSKIVVIKVYFGRLIILTDEEAPRLC